MADDPRGTHRGEPTVMELVLDRIDAVERNLGGQIGSLADDLREVKKQTQLTNGRVTVLEKARERAQGVMFAFSWLPLALSAILTAGLTILVMALSGSIH